MTGILDKLRGGDRRSIGRANEVVADVTADPSLFGELLNGMLDEDPLIRMRAADAVEKLTADHAEWLRPYKTTLIEEVAAVDQQEVRWHLAQIIPRLDLTLEERRKAIDLLLGYRDDRSAIVRTCALQALADLAANDPPLRRRVMKLLERAVGSDSAAVRSRAKKLLTKLSGRN